MASSIGIGNLNTESIELNTSALNLHNRIPVDPSLIHGNDIYVAPTGGLTEKWTIRICINWRFVFP